VWLAGGQQLISNSNTPVLSDLWSWDGARWSELSANTATPMITHKLFVDAAGRLLAALSQGLVARWDGQHWITVVANSASRRESAAGAYDAERKQFVTFGGLIGGRAYDTTGETWAFAGTQWTRIATTGPPAMLGGAMAFDSRRRVLVLFGGLDIAGRKLPDTWEWNGTHWTRVATTGPAARFGAGIAFDQTRGETVIFGGVDAENQKLADTWRWDGTRWRQAASAVAPPRRSEGYLAYDEMRRVCVLFGGEGVDVVPTLGDTWEWNGTSWTRVR